MTDVTPEPRTDGPQSHQAEVRRCSGPKTAAGKKRARMNALRHGLTRARPRFDARSVATLSRLIGGNVETLIERDYATTAADAQLQVTAVRKIRSKIVAQAIGAAQHANACPNNLDELNFGPTGSSARKQTSASRREMLEAAARAVLETYHKLEILDRYERRAMSRRNRALRSLVDARARNEVASSALPATLL